VTNAQSITIVKDGAGICPGGKIGLSCSEPDILDYTWEFLRPAPTGWSTLTGKTSSSISHNEIGQYRLTVRDINGVVKISNILNVIGLSSPPIPVITPSRNVTQICQGDSIILNTAIQTGYFYYWSFNNTQLVVPQNEAVKLVAKNAGKYELLVVDNSLNSNSCSSKSLPYNLDYTSTVTVKIDSLPPFCGLTIPPKNLVATPSGGKFKGVGITDTNLGTFNPSTAGVGKHEISYELAQNGSCPSLVEKRTFIVSDPKAIITTNTGKTQFCQGDIATLSAPAGMKKYEWFLAGNPVGSLNKLDVGAGGDFQLKITDDVTCESLSPLVKIEFFNATTVTTDLIPSVCGTEFPSVPLKGIPSGGAFTIDGVFATIFDYKKLGFGKHKIFYQLDGSLPCLKGSAEQEVVIQDYPKPNLGSDILLGKGNSIILKGFVDQNMTYLWTPTIGLDNPILASPTANPTQTTEYTLTVKTTLGCEGKDIINVVVYQPVYIPSAFTPNADGMNDLWELQGIEVYPNTEVQIYNRWGNIVFYSKGFYVPFDGTDNNKPLPEGMYVYKINPFPDRPDFQYKGTFMLFR
jgi:gliding motility-associated-like protein